MYEIHCLCISTTCSFHEESLREKAPSVPGTGVTAVNQIDVASDFKTIDTKQYKQYLHFFTEEKLQSYERAWLDWGLGGFPKEVATPDEERIQGS